MNDLLQLLTKLYKKILFSDVLLFWKLLRTLPSDDGEYSIEYPRPALQALLLVSREQEKSLLTSVILFKTSISEK